MFRKLLITGVAATALLMPLAWTSSAQAHDEHHGHHSYYHRYTVVYRAYPFGHWRVYGVYHSRRSAHEAAEWLRIQGFSASEVYR
jgi:hypothetical protein